jgi:HEAT repeat protein
LWRLAEVGPDAKAVVPKLLELSKDKDGGRAIGAVWALWRLEKYPSTVAILEKGLNSSDHLARYMAARYLGEIEPRPKDAVPFLLRAVDQDDNRLVRNTAAAALRKIDPEAADKVGR